MEIVMQHDCSEAIEVLLFSVGGEDYAVNINSNREIRG